MHVGHSNKCVKIGQFLSFSKWQPSTPLDLYKWPSFLEFSHIWHSALKENLEY